MIQNVSIMCEGPVPQGYSICRKLSEIEAAHAAPKGVDVCLPPCIEPDLSRPVIVHNAKGHRLATNGGYAIGLVRARGDVTLVDARIKRDAMLASHGNLAALERALIAQAVEALSKETLGRWTAICSGPIDERHRRLSLLRAQLQSTRAAIADLPTERIVQNINQIIAQESRRAWA